MQAHMPRPPTTILSPPDEPCPPTTILSLPDELLLLIYREHFRTTNPGTNAAFIEYMSSAPTSRLRAVATDAIVSELVVSTVIHTSPSSNSPRELHATMFPFRRDRAGRWGALPESVVPRIRYLRIAMVCYGRRALEGERAVAAVAAVLDELPKIRRVVLAACTHVRRAVRRYVQGRGVVVEAADWEADGFDDFAEPVMQRLKEETRFVRERTRIRRLRGAAVLRPRTS